MSLSIGLQTEVAAYGALLIVAVEVFFWLSMAVISPNRNHEARAIYPALLAQAAVIAVLIVILTMASLRLDGNYEAVRDIASWLRPFLGGAAFAALGAHYWWRYWNGS